MESLSILPELFLNVRKKFLPGQSAYALEARTPTLKEGLSVTKEDNLDLYNQVRSVPATAKRPIKGGRMNGMTDINPMWRIKTLTEQFGPCGIGWYYIPVKKWTETINGETAAFVDIELYVKCGEEWSRPIYGTGGSMLAAKERGGIHVSDECYKMATTDAISVACKQLGIGADVYWEADRTKYSDADSSGTSDSGTNRSDRNRTNTNALPAGKDEPPVLEARYVNSLYKELSRTGVGLNEMLKHYRKTDIHQLSIQEYKHAMDTLLSKPDKPLDPRMVPPETNASESDLPPWEQEERYRYYENIS